MSIERINLAPSGNRFRALFVTPGIVNYSDAKQNPGQELLRKEAIDESIESFIGAPLTLGHIPTDVQNIEDYANGKVDAVGFDAESGWHFCEGTVDTDAARKAIRDGWGISSGTRVTKVEPNTSGETWLNNSYDREIKKLKFHHLALIRPGGKPRYEEAQIRLNARENPAMAILPRWIRKMIGADNVASEQVTDVAPTALVDLGEGKRASLGDLLDLARENAVHCMGPDDYVEHEGCRYNCGELVKAYREKMAKPAEGHHAPAGEVARINDGSPAAALAKPADEAGHVPAGGPEPVPATILPAPAQSPQQGGEPARINAIVDPAVEAEAKRAREAAEAQAAADLAAARRAEVDRLNATREAGAKSFAQLGQARTAPKAIPFVRPASRDDRIAAGKKLFGSAV